MTVRCVIYTFFLTNAKVLTIPELFAPFENETDVMDNLNSDVPVVLHEPVRCCPAGHDARHAAQT